MLVCRCVGIMPQHCASIVHLGGTKYELKIWPAGCVITANYGLF